MAVLQVVQHDAGAAEARGRERRQVVVREQDRVGAQCAVEAGALLGEEAWSAPADLLQPQPRRCLDLVTEASIEAARGAAQHCGGDRQVGHAAQQVVEHLLGAADAAGEDEMRRHEQVERRDVERAVGGVMSISAD